MQNKYVNKVVFGQFTVFTNNANVDYIVDNNITDKIEKYSWSLDCAGYLCANINSQVTRLHEYVMFLNHMKKPDKYYIDHINLDKHDNRLCNLRFVSTLESSLNMPLKANNTSGVTGVTLTKHGSYRAYITIKHKRIELGTYKTIQEAANARLEAETRLGFKTRPCNIAFLCEMENNDKAKNN